MATIDISRSHTIGRERARVAMESLAKKLERSVDARYRWVGDEIRLHRSGATARVHVGEDEVRVVIELGLALRLIKGPVSRRVHDYLDESLG